jgi:hypothetical protein
MKKITIYYKANHKESERLVEFVLSVVNETDVHFIPSMSATNVDITHFPHIVLHNYYNITSRPDKHISGFTNDTKEIIIKYLDNA